MESILSLIILLGAAQGGILSLVLFLSKFNKIANQILALAIFVVSIALLLAYFQFTLDYKVYTFLIKSTLPLSLLFTPLIYIYIKVITMEIDRFSFAEMKYFLPFLGIIGYNLPFYIGSSVQKIGYYERENITNSAYLTEQLEIILVSLILLGFSIAIVLLVLKMRSNFEREVANYREELIQLMFFVAWSVFAFILTGLVLSIFQVFGVNYPSILDFLTAIGTTFLIYFIGYYTLSHVQVFQPPIKISKKEEIIETIKPTIYEGYLTKIIAYMEKEKPYKNPELTLSTFAEALNIPAYLVSKILNSELQLSFYNFINKYRIEEVKVELLKSDAPQILIIAFDAGFNSKSSFYNYFKKEVGTTPKRYIMDYKSEKITTKKSI